MINIIHILSFLDSYIYANYSKIELTEAANVSDKISKSDISRHFDVSEWNNSIGVYAQTIIRVYSSANDFEVYTLVKEYKEDKENVIITHNSIALQYYLFPTKDVEIINSHIKSVFVTALRQHKFNAEIFFDRVMRTRNYSCTPDDFKADFGVNYINALLRVKLISPIERKIQEMYDTGILPFYINCDVQRSLFAPGGKIVKFKFNLIDHIQILREHRERPIYIKDISLKLQQMIPFDYPFVEPVLLEQTDNTIYSIYNMLMTIDQDPDYNKVDIGFLIKYRLKSFGINL